MNFIEWHIGDWIKHTKGLTHVQRAIYSDLLMAYYTHERPFKDRREAYGEAGANTKALRADCDYVLERYFREQPDGTLSHDRADEEIHRYQQKKPQAEQKRENERERQDRVRAEKKRMCQVLSDRGITVPWNITMEKLRALLADELAKQPRATVDNAVENGERTAPVTALGHAPVTRDNTATSPQSPVPSNSEPVRASSTELGAAEDARALVVQELAEKAAQAMAAAGLQDVNASDPVLQQLLRDGITVPELAAAAADASRKGKGAGWALARAVGRRQDAKKTAVHQDGEGAAAANWRDSRDGVEAMGKLLGIGPWVQFDSASGRTCPWPTYLARVERAAAERADEREQAEAEA